MRRFVAKGGITKYRGRDLKDRPLGKLKTADITREEVDTALMLLLKAYEAMPLTDSNDRPATHVREWQRQCQNHGLDTPGKFRELCLAAKARGVAFSIEGRVHWGFILKEPRE